MRVRIERTDARLESAVEECGEVGIDVQVWFGYLVEALNCQPAASVGVMGTYLTPKMNEYSLKPGTRR